ncbi:hypothetical protein AB6A40_010000, partial [Gnathostoma spinigerum]
VQSSLTAEQVCEAARGRPIFHDDGCPLNYTLFEVIKGGELERRISHREKMSSIVTGRWLDWDPNDCYLVFKRDQMPFCLDRVLPFADDVKVADPGSKTFTTSSFKLESGSKIVQYSKACERIFHALKPINEWSVDETLWFIGHELTRKPPYFYTLTFIPLKKSLKYKSKFFGYCLSFQNDAQRVGWLNAVLSCQDDQTAPTAPLLQI